MWKFREIGEGEPERFPRESEFFIAGDLDITSSLVRETIQNSLDARRETPVRVRFSFISHNMSEVRQFYGGLVEHLRACNLLDADFSEGQPFRLFIAEDFMTTGLTGSIKRDQISETSISDYYNFWWREGIGQKHGKHGGRWGLGKVTFHGVSRFHSYWGLTIRFDDKRTFLLGKSLLKPHQYNGRWFDYYGYFASEGYKPIEDKTILDGFCAKFGISRKFEPGLSIVIPMVREEINTDAIIRATIMHYFLPIAKGELIVEIKVENSSLVTINGSTLREIARLQNWDGTIWQDRDVNSLIDFVESAKNIHNSCSLVELGSSGNGLTISEALFGGSLELLRDNFRAGQPLGFKIPVEIKPISDSPRKSYFSVFVQRDENLDKADEFYWRSGILIANIRMLGRHQVRALLSADDEPISRFLGDSETPAHADWNERTEDFKKKYNKARDTLRFVKSSIREIVRILDLPPPGRETDFLKETFHVIEPSIELDNGNETESQIIKPRPQPPPPRQSIFDVLKIQGGFRLSLIDTKIELPLEIVVITAYDVRRGSPFKKYSRWDFDLSNMSRSISGGQELDVSGNRVRLRVDNYNFTFDIKGFDLKRDIVVRISRRS